MYEDFGARVDGRSVELSLFLPDNTVDPSQYEGDGDPRLHSLQVAGTFQPHLGTTAWDPATAPALTPRPHPNGVRWTVDLGDLPDGLYFTAEDRYLADAGGYGVDSARRLAIYHRWGKGDDGRLERFIVVLNFSDDDQWTDIPFSTNGVWTDLLNRDSIDVGGFA